MPLGAVSRKRKPTRVFVTLVADRRLRLLRVIIRNVAMSCDMSQYLRARLQLIGAAVSKCGANRLSAATKTSARGCHSCTLEPNVPLLHHSRDKLLTYHRSAFRRIGRATRSLYTLLLNISSEFFFLSPDNRRLKLHRISVIYILF